MSMIQEQAVSPAQIDELMRSRRSVFPDQFEKGRQIPDEIIFRLLENANWAPNHKHTEPWRFVVFTGEGLARFAGFQAERYKETAGDRFRKDKYEKLGSTPQTCSHVLAIILKRSSGLPVMEEIAAVACAVQNIHLTVAAYGLGGYWSTGGVTYDPGARDFFGLEGEDVLMGFFYLGYVLVPSAAGKRGAAAEKIKWVRE